MEVLLIFTFHLKNQEMYKYLLYIDPGSSVSSHDSWSQVSERHAEGRVGVPHGSPDRDHRFHQCDVPSCSTQVAA